MSVLNEAILEHLKKLEKNLSMAIEDANKNETLYRGYANSIKEEIIEILKANEMSEGNYYELKNIFVLSEIPIKELKDNFSENILDNICVTIDLEATKEHLKRDLGLTDIVIEPIVKKLSKLNLRTKEELVKKEVL